MTHHKRACSIHKVRELKLQKVSLDKDYHVLRQVGEGSYGKVHLAKHRQTGHTIALKAVSKEHTKLRDFLREFHYSYFLSPHPSILNSYDVAFQTDTQFLFAQEFSPSGDLARVLDEGHLGLDESKVKVICQQVASALDFMHSKDLVHRDVRPHNILLFEKDFSVVKLTDFGLTRLAGTLVKKTNVCLPYMPPEICEAVYNEGYTVETSSDVWQLAILVMVCLNRKVPWQRADITDANFTEFLQWQKRKSTKTPSVLKPFSARLTRMLRRMLEPKSENRCSVKEMFKYVNDRWLTVAAGLHGAGGPIRDKRMAGSKSDGGSVVDSGHDPAGAQRAKVSDKRNANSGGALGHLLMSYGIETTIDYETKKKRIHDWILTTSP